MCCSQVGTRLAEIETKGKQLAHARLPRTLLMSPGRTSSEAGVPPPFHADCDVYFRKRMKLVDWGVPLPTAIGMG